MLQANEHTRTRSLLGIVPHDWKMWRRFLTAPDARTVDPGKKCLCGTGLQWHVKIEVSVARETELHEVRVMYTLPAGVTEFMY